MSMEIWIFSPDVKYKPRGGIVAIEVAPREYNRVDAEHLARKIRDGYAADGVEVSTVVRQEAGY